MVLPFHAILSPVDLDENSLSALEYAPYFAQQAKARLYLLYVIPPDELHLLPELYHRDQSGGADLVWAEKTAKEMLHEIARERLNGGIRYEILTRVGGPAPMILEVAEDVEADLIVLTTHGRHGMARFLRGSVAETVVRESVCPVLIIRRRERHTGTGVNDER